MNKPTISIFLSVVLVLLFQFANAQDQLLRRIGQGGGGGGRSGGQDSLKHRTGHEDSITITFRYLDTTRYGRFDSSLYDFTKRYPIPWNYTWLGNTGSAAQSMLFDPYRKAGWDAGFHSFDLYQFNLKETKFYNTTRPYTELGYLLGSRAEQVISIIHTQNINPDWNFAFEYKLINSPGLFKNQSVNHGGYRLNTMYQSPNRRYHLFFVMFNNKVNASENGGIRNDQDYLDSLRVYKDRATIPVQLGNGTDRSLSLFGNTVSTGTKYKTTSIFLRQQYDLGRKDSLVRDTIVTRLFYPTFRMEHSIQYSSYRYGFYDANAGPNSPDTAFYKNNYNFSQVPTDIRIEDRWSELVNDVSLYQFPDPKNPQQFIKLGAFLQNLKGKFDASEREMYNIAAHGEYRNKTRNQKWDIEATGQLYLAGFHAGDYEALVSLQRLLSKNIGYLKAGFQNVNRTPSFIFENSSSFSFAAMPAFNKENITRVFATLEQPKNRLKLSGNYYLFTNYTYFKNYYQADQASSLFNVLQVTAEKDFKLSRTLVWHAAVTVQQKAGNAPINIPLVVARTIIGYEGNLGFKNLLLNTGLDMRYHTPYKANGYSPMLGQFFYQDKETIRLYLPDIAAFLHFRIRSFKAYVRAENLNTMSIREGFGFTRNNMAAPGYAYQGLQIRFGIFWSFVN